MEGQFSAAPRSKLDAGVVHVMASVARRDGGPSTAVRNIDKALRSKGVRSFILATVADGPRASLDFPTHEVVAEDGAHIWYCRRSRPLALMASWQQLARLWRASANVGTIHVHGVYLANSIYSYVVARLRKKPYVVHPHGTLEPYQERKGSRRKRLFNCLIGERILRNADAVIACSQMEVESLRARGQGYRVYKATLGAANPEPRRPAWSDEVLSDWLSEPRSRRLIFLGRLAKKKRPDLLLDAWAMGNTSGALLIVGPQEDWTHEQLESHLPGGAQDHRVYFAPAASAAESAWLLQHAGIFVLPSENENFGISVVEAMLNGCAVIVTAATGSSEHVKRAGAGIVLGQLSAEGVAQAMQLLVHDERLTREFGVRATNYAADNLTWEAATDQIASIYSTVNSGVEEPDVHA
ncbi:glycosyltransferase [Cryptosporangium sp. NPDC048952]|uniref:glycosyltransferase n=1 Tax=Cryptosporangium sp. NPDC048952 TaxID=3363961 RepID=UPI00371486B0